MIYDEVKTRVRLKRAIKKSFADRKTDLPASFLAFFKTLDLTILERSWSSVKLSGVKNDLYNLHTKSVFDFKGC